MYGVKGRERDVTSALTMQYIAVKRIHAMMSLDSVIAMQCTVAIS